MKFAVFISSGIGNAIFLIPLVKELKKLGEVHAICDSPYFSERIFQRIETHLFSKIIEIRSGIQITSFMMTSFSKYDHIYLDYFSATRKNLAISTLTSRNVHTYKIPKGLPSLFKKSIHLHQLKIGVHEGTQYKRFIIPDSIDSNLSEADFKIDVRPSQRNLPEHYITIQPGAGNNLTPWKTWPLPHWIELLQQIVRSFPRLQIVVFGDEHDLLMEPYFMGVGSNIHSLINKTSMEELPELFAKSLLHIGGDSGLLHVAGAVGVQTITIVGGSDPEIFGWDKINSNRHVLIQNKLACHPCYRHYLPNQSRTKNPSNCPDFKCIREVAADEVFSVFRTLIHSKD